MSGPHVTIDPDPLEANDVDRAYAEGFADAWDATKPAPPRRDRLGAVIAIAATVALVVVAFAAGRASAAPRSAQTTERVGLGAPSSAGLIGAPRNGGQDFGLPDRSTGPATSPAVVPPGAPQPTDPPAISGGLASYVGRSFGPRYLALPNGPGHRVRICGPAACVVRTSTDAGPDLAMQRAGRIADLSFADFGTVCGCAPATIGLVAVTVEDLTGPAQTPPATDVDG